MSEPKDRGVVDPGHGGPDPGAMDPVEPEEGDFIATEEEDITLPIGLRVAELLKPVFDIAITRIDDTALDDFRKDLVRRALMGDGAAWFVSIHLNSNDDPRGRGTETYHLPGSEEGKALAEAIQHRLVAALGLRDREVKEAEFAVLKTKARAAALTEICFISNPQEEALISRPEIQELAARAIAQGVCDYMGIDGVRIIAKGMVTYGKIIDGRTWAPVRAIAEAVGREAEWSEATSTVEV